MENSQLENDIAVSSFREKRIRKPQSDPDKLLKSAVCGTCSFPKLPNSKCTYCVRRKQRQTAIRRQQEVLRSFKKPDDLETLYKEIFTSNFGNKDRRDYYKFQTMWVLLMEISKVIHISADSCNAQVDQSNLLRLARLLKTTEKVLVKWNRIKDDRDRESLKAHLGRFIAGDFGLTI